MKELKHFEKSIKELEEIVTQLEKGDLTLEESLKIFEQGIGLSEACVKILDHAENKVNLLIKTKSGEVLNQPFASEEQDV